jgi:hypothetical protein
LDFAEFMFGFSGFIFDFTVFCFNFTGYKYFGSTIQTKNSSDLIFSYFLFGCPENEYPAKFNCKDPKKLAV